MKRVVFRPLAARDLEQLPNRDRDRGERGRIFDASDLPWSKRLTLPEHFGKCVPFPLSSESRARKVGRTTGPQPDFGQVAQICLVNS